MKIIIQGNIGSGKSTISDQLIHQIGDINYLGIDSIRKIHGDGTQEMENQCKDKFIEAIELNEDDQIIELSGIGILADRLYEKLADYRYPVLVVNLIVDAEEIHQRIEDRIWDTPFPIGVENIPNAISFTETKIMGGLFFEHLKKCQGAVFLTLYNNQEMLKRNVSMILQNFLFFKSLGTP